MSRNSVNWIVEQSNQTWKYLFTISLLELFGHVITDLSDTMKGCVSDFWVWMLKVLNNDWDHDTNVLNIIDILTNLWEGHECSILVSPVWIIVHCVVNNHTQDWKADGISNTWDNFINAPLTKVNIIFIVLFVVFLVFETFLGSKPWLRNIFININHKSENQLNQFFKELCVFLDDIWNSLNDCNKELNGKLSDLRIGKVLL